MSKSNAREAIRGWRDDSLGAEYLERIERETGLDAEKAPAAVAAMVVRMGRADGLEI